MKADGGKSMGVKGSESSVKKERKRFESIEKKNKNCKQSEMYLKPFGFKKGSCIL